MAFAAILLTVLIPCRANPQAGSSAAPKAAGADLLLHPDADCTVKIDGRSIGQIKQGGSRILHVSLGQHLVEADSNQGGLHWEKVVNVENANQMVVSIAVKSSRNDDASGAAGNKRDDQDSKRTSSTSAPAVPRVPVGGNVAAARLINKVMPKYPPEARKASIEGTVRFNALIGTDGAVKELHLVSGDPLLAQAAMEAVKQWVYSPTLVNGNAVEVQTQIDVNFTLTKSDQLASANDQAAPPLQTPGNAPPPHVPPPPKPGDRDLLPANVPPPTPPARVGLLRLDAAVTENMDGKKATAELQATFGPKQKEMESKRSEITTLEERIRITTGAERDDLTRTRDQLVQAFNRDIAKASADVEAARQQAINTIAPRMRDVVDRYGRAFGYSLLLNISGPGGPVLYANPRAEITKKIVEKYDAYYGSGTPIQAPPIPYQGYSVSLIRFRQALVNTIDGKAGKAIEELSPKFRQALVEFAQANEYTVVIDSGNAQAGILYASDRLDITDDMVRSYDARQRGAPLAPRDVGYATIAVCNIPHKDASDLERLRVAVGQYAARHDYNLILDVNDPNGSILYADVLDITKDIQPVLALKTPGGASVGGHEERQAAERQAAERQAAERQAAERQAAERQAAERQAAERQAAERQAAEDQAAARADREERIANLRGAIESDLSMANDLDGRADDLEAQGGLTALTAPIMRANAQRYRNKAANEQDDLDQLTSANDQAAMASNVNDQAVSPQPDSPAAQGSYAGPNSNWVHQLLGRVGGWSCPSSMSAQDGKAPQLETPEGMRDKYVDAAVQHAWAAECYARNERDNEAQQQAEEMMKMLQAAQSLCSNAPVISTGPVTPLPTERIYRCGELSGSVSAPTYSASPAPAAQPVQVAPPSPVKPPPAQRLSYWYHGINHAQPFFYDPSIAGSANNAQRTCEQQSHETCVPAKGSAAPAL
jgi:TonB family protein